MFMCPNCGTQFDENANPQLRPLTMWQYFGYQILFSLPVIGFICLLVFAFGATQNINLRNFARSYFCYFIIMFVIFAIIAAITVPVVMGLVDNVVY